MSIYHLVNASHLCLKYLTYSGAGSWRICGYFLRSYMYSLLSVNYCWGQWTTGVVIELLFGHWTDCLFWTIFAHKTHKTKNKVKEINKPRDFDWTAFWPVTSGEGTKSRVDFCYFVFASFKRVRSARHSKVQQQQRALFAWPYKYIQCCKSYFKNQNYIIGKLRHFGTVICHEDQSKLKYIFMNSLEEKEQWQNTTTTTNKHLYSAYIAALSALHNSHTIM